MKCNLQTVRELTAIVLPFFARVKIFQAELRRADEWHHLEDETALLVLAERQNIALEPRETVATIVPSLVFTDSEESDLVLPGSNWNPSCNLGIHCGVPGELVKRDGTSMSAQGGNGLREVARHFVQNSRMKIHRRLQLLDRPLGIVRGEGGPLRETCFKHNSMTYHTN